MAPVLRALGYQTGSRRLFICAELLGTTLSRHTLGRAIIRVPYLGSFLATTQGSQFQDRNAKRTALLRFRKLIPQFRVPDSHKTEQLVARPEVHNDDKT